MWSPQAQYPDNYRLHPLRRHCICKLQSAQMEFRFRLLES